MSIYTIRGATTIDNNSEKEIERNVVELLTRILEKNSISSSDCISIIFTATKDITAAYPAKYARKMGFTNTSLLCMQEMYVENSLSMCIRCLITINIENEKFTPKSIYLKNAATLRPDLLNK